MEKDVKHIKQKKGNEALILFCAGCYKTSMRNYSAVPRKAILRVLAQKTVVLLVNENNTTKKCFKCKQDVKEILNIKEKKIKDRLYNKWSKSNLRNVRYCENKSCITGDYDKFIIGRDTNASNNILINGFNKLKDINLKIIKPTILGGKHPKTEHTDL